MYVLIRTWCLHHHHDILCPINSSCNNNNNNDKSIPKSTTAEPLLRQPWDRGNPYHRPAYLRNIVTTNRIVCIQTVTDGQLTMVTLDRQEIIANNKSLRLIKNVSVLAHKHIHLSLSLSVDI